MEKSSFRSRTRSAATAISVLAGIVLAPTVATVVAPAAHAECSSIPADRDIAVIRKVYEVGQRLNVSPKVLLAGFETGWVESHMNNLPCGDRDSLGVFQQRPSQGWGTAAQVQNVDYASNSFFTRAITVDRNNPGFSAGQIAQKVQVSAFPDRYDQAQSKAQSLMNEAFQPYGTIGNKWRAAGAGSSPVGNPVRVEENSKLGGRFTEFQKGMIIWNSANNQAWMVYGQILGAYRSTGSEEKWGFPVQDEADASASPTGSKGRFQKFGNALILWSPQTGARIVSGDIRIYFENNGFETRFGYPTSGEIAETGGVYQNFELGSLHWRSSDRSVTWRAN